ncbi:MAG: hypothetical protein ACQGVC_05780 [Myxococcota bacterium]
MIAQFEENPLPLPSDSLLPFLSWLAGELGYIFPAAGVEELIASPPTDPLQLARSAIALDGGSCSETSDEFERVLERACNAFLEASHTAT